MIVQVIQLKYDSLFDFNIIASNSDKISVIILYYKVLDFKLIFNTSDEGWTLNRKK